jgi:hypothetical protein
MGYSNCNPCDPCGTNQNAAKAAAYARQANTYATNAENSWLQFNALYLGAFAVAPAVDNEGEPLQVGALYWNSSLNNLWAWNGTSWMPAVEGELYLGGFATAPTLDNEGNPLQLGNLYWNTASNNLWAYNGTSWVETEFNEFTPFLATGTTTARNLVTREAEIVNVRDFGAVGNGVTDDSVAFQNALNLIQSRPNGGTLFIPAGNYLINTTLTYSDNSLTIIGEGQKITNIIKSSGTDLFVFNGRKLGLTADFLTVKSIRFLCARLNNGVGSAIKAIWPENMTARQCCNLSDLTFFPLAENGAVNWWNNCIYIRNASQSAITNITSWAVNSTQQTHIRLDYSNNPSAYAVLMQNLFFQGGLYGIHQTGCVEMVMISRGEIVGQQISILCDASASLIPSAPVGRNPVLNVESLHLNGKEWGLKTIQWNAVQARNLQLYHGVGSGTDINGGNISIEKCKFLSIVGCTFGTPLSLPIEDRGVILKEVEEFIIAANLFTRNSRANIDISDSYRGKITSNAFQPNFAINYSIFVQNNIIPTGSNKIRITDNTFLNAQFGIFINNGASDFDIFNNNFDDIAGVPILLGSPVNIGQQIAITGNKAIAWQRKTLTNNDATPSVSGAQEGLCVFSNSNPTTITDFTDGYPCQELDISADNGNTTIQNNANIILQGGVNFAMATGNMLFLKKTDSGANIWYETGRLT